MSLQPLRCWGKALARLISVLFWLVSLYGAVGTLVSSDHAATFAIEAWPSHAGVEVHVTSLAVGVVFVSCLSLLILCLRLVAARAELAKSWALAIARLTSSRDRSFDALLLAVLGIVLLGAVAAFQRQASPLSVAVVISLASGAVLAVWLLVSLLWRGETIEFESRWGGISGDLGGFRLSRTASLALVALGLVVGSVAAIQPAVTSDGGASKPPVASAGNTPAEKTGVSGGSRSDKGAE